MLQYVFLLVEFSAINVLVTALCDKLTDKLMDYFSILCESVDIGWQVDRPVVIQPQIQESLGDRRVFMTYQSTIFMIMTVVIFLLFPL